MTPIAVSVPKAAQMMGIGRTLAFSLVRTGALRTLKIGRRTLIPVANIEAFIRSTATVGD